MDINVIINHLLARLKEPSTWAGFSALCVALAPALPGEAKALGTAATVCGAIAAMLLKENGAAS